MSDDDDVDLREFFSRKSTWITILIGAVIYAYSEYAEYGWIA
jgi:hypothetical protein